MTTVGMTDDDRARAHALEQIAYYCAVRDASRYYVGQYAARLADLGHSAADIRALVDEHLSGGKSPLSSPSQVTKYVAWGRLPDEGWVRALGVTRAYELSGEQGWQQDAIRAADPADTYTWSAFDADWLGKTPIEEQPTCLCPSCGKAHTPPKVTP